MTETGREERARRWPAALAAAGLAVAAAALMLAAGVEVPWRVAAGALGAGLAGFAGQVLGRAVAGPRSRRLARMKAGLGRVEAGLLRVETFDRTLAGIRRHAESVAEWHGPRHTELRDRLDAVQQHQALLLRRVGEPPADDPAGVTLWGKLDVFTRVLEELNAQGEKAYKMRFDLEARVKALEAGTAGAASFVALLRSLAEAAEKAARPLVAVTYPPEPARRRQQDAVPALEVGQEVVLPGHGRFRLVLMSGQTCTCSACDAGTAKIEGGCRVCDGSGWVVVVRLPADRSLAFQPPVLVLREVRGGLGAPPA